MISPKVADTSCGAIEYIDLQENATSPREVIIVLHGGMGGYDQADIFRRAVGPSGYRYIAVSRPGYLGTPLEKREAPEAQADAVAALMDHLEIDEVILFAVSAGGCCALTFALRYPGRCKALVLCSSIGGVNAIPVPFTFHVMKLVSRVPILLKALRNRTEKSAESFLKRSIPYHDIYERTVKNQRALSLYRELLVSCLSQTAKRLAGTANDLRIIRATEYPLQNITAPALVIHGTEDSLVPFKENGMRLAEGIPGAKLCDLERGEHIAIFTHNEQVVKSVADFLEDL